MTSLYSLPDSVHYIFISMSDVTFTLCQIVISAPFYFWILFSSLSIYTFLRVCVCQHHNIYNCSRIENIMIISRRVLLSCSLLTNYLKYYRRLSLHIVYYTYYTWIIKSDLLELSWNYSSICRYQLVLISLPLRNIICSFISLSVALCTATDFYYICHRSLDIFKVLLTLYMVTFSILFHVSL